MEKQLKEIKEEVDRLERVVLTNRAMIMFLCHGLKMSNEEIDRLEMQCENMVQKGFEEYEEEEKKIK